jgi:RNA-directed DNA polymerase
VTANNSTHFDAATYTVERLCADLGLTYQTLSSLGARIDRGGYHRFVDSKRNKTRVFDEPAPSLKIIQRALVDRFFVKLPASEHVYSRRGLDVVRNAARHVGRAYRLSMDLSDCYPSTTLSLIREALTGLGLRSEVIGLVARLVTYNGRLPQGSPASSAVLDCVLYRLDEALARLAAEYGATYTRWVDDLSFSADVPLTSLARRVKRLVRAHGYVIKDRKTRHSRPGELHTVTGISVGSVLHAPPQYLDRVGREITAFSRGRRSQKERSIDGKIQWVNRLNSSEAGMLDRKMIFATAKRRARRLRTKTE